MSERGSDRRHEFELLCERCGYCIEGLSPESHCPECGRPVETSIPESRPGSPWQRGPGLRAWVSTDWRTLRSPRQTIRSIAIEGERSRTLGVANCFLAAVPLSLLSGFWVLRYVLNIPRPLWEERSLFASVGIGALYVCCALLGTWLAQWLVLLGLTKTEAVGIRVFGSMHRTRMTATVAKAITGHATAGWMAGSVLASLGFAAGLLLHDRAMHHNVGAARGAFMLAPIWIPVLGGFVGLLWFEVIVYLGVLNCRFANRSKSDVPSSPAWSDSRAQGLDVQGEPGQST